VSTKSGAIHPDALGRTLKYRVLLDSIEVSGSPLQIGITLKIGNVCRVVHQLMAAHARESHEVRQVGFKDLQ